MSGRQKRFAHAWPRILYDAVMDFLVIDGVRLEVRRIGAPAGSDGSSPVVFLHEGLGCVSLWTQRGIDWPAQVCAASGRAGVVYSRRGYGQSDPTLEPLPPDYMHREAWTVLPALLDALHIKNPVLLGHSDGATIALLHASRHAVAACIAMAPHVLVEDVAVEAIAEATTAFASGGLKDRLARHHADATGAFRQWNDVWLSAGFRNFDIRNECRRIHAPLLLIQGLDDDYGTMRQLDEIAHAAPQAAQLRLDHCGHSPHRDQPNKTISAVAAFMKSIR
jgi:pimeloyl-ACP methyl ester carboxylesterase